MNRISPVLCLFVVAALTPPSVTQGATIGWANNTSNADAFWNTGTNWSGGAVPTAGDIANFTFTVTNAESANLNGATVDILGITAGTRTSSFSGYSYAISATGGGTINLGSSGIGFTQAPNISEGRRFTINGGINLTANQTWRLDRAGAQINSTGIISGNFSITQQGVASGDANRQQSVFLVSQNTFSGGYILNAPDDSNALTIQASSTLNGSNDVVSGPGGTGTLTLTSGRIRSRDGTARTVNNSVILNGNITVGGGTVVIDGASTSSTGAMTFGASNNSTFNISSATSNVNRTLTTHVNTTIGHGIGETGGGARLGLTKAGNSILTLQGANTYTGNTTITAGSMILSSASTQLFEITDTVANQVNGSGTAAFEGAFKLDLAGVTDFTSNAWTLVDTGSLNETFGATFSVLDNAGALVFTQSSDIWTATSGVTTWTFTEATGVLAVSTVPEPSATLLFGFAISGFLFLRRIRYANRSLLV